MKRLVMKPDGWPCTLAECPVGYFTLESMLGFKSEYGNEAYCDAGEYLMTVKDDNATLVQPVRPVWEEYK